MGGVHLDGSKVTDGGSGFPLRLLSWGNLIASVYELMENPKFKDLEIVKKIREKGLVVIVRTLNMKAPDSICVWLAMLLLLLLLRLQFICLLLLQSVFFYYTNG